MHPSGIADAMPPPLAGAAFKAAAARKASPVRGYGAERRLRRRKLFLVWQTAVTPFIIACSAIESIGPPFAHRSGLYRFAVMQRSQSTSVLQHAPCDAGTANRTVDAPSGADGGVRRLAAPLPLRVGRACIAAFVGDDACIVPRGLRLDDGFAPPAGKSRIVGRAISPADAGGDRRAVCGISQAIAPKGCGSQKASGGRERPPYRLTGNVCRAFCHLLAARRPGPMKIIGPYAKAGAPRKEPSNARRQCTPAAPLPRRAKSPALQITRKRLPGISIRRALTGCPADRTACPTRGQRTSPKAPSGAPGRR